MFRLTQKKPKFSVLGLTENLIPTENLALWLRADKGVIIDSSGGIDTVARWEDQSTNKYHLIQVVKTAQPLFQVSGLNRLPTLSFQENQYLEGNISFTYYTAYLVSRFMPSPNFGSAMYEISDDGSVNKSSAFFRENNDFKIRRSVSGNTFDTSSINVNSDYHIFTCEVQESLCRLTRGDTVLAESMQQLSIGNGLKYIVGSLFENYYRLNGNISEIVFYAAAHNESKRKLVKNYLKNKYALT